VTLAGSRTSRPRTLHLGLNLVYGGTHPAAWRAAYADPRASYTAGYWVDAVKLAEKAKFDFAFHGDLLTTLPPEAGPPMVGMDPAILLATLANVTSHIGFVSTASTTFDQPFHIARRFSTFDHLSGGRAGWNIVTTYDENAAKNFSALAHPPKSERYARADEFVEVVKALWDSWRDDAILADKESGIFADPARVQAINHRGPYYVVDGPLNVPRSPQGRPVLVQAGGSAGGIALAAKHAEIVFCALSSLDHAREFATTLKGQAAAQGRPDDAIRIMPGFGFTIGGTEQEARRRYEELEAFLGGARIHWLAYIIGADPSDLAHDRPLPEALLAGQGGPPLTEGMQKMVFALGREGLTVGEILERVGTSHRQVVGTPEQIADEMERWFLSGAIDGFNVMADELLTGLAAFAGEVVPLLQRRGVFRTDYQGPTLRDQLGLPRPAR